AGVTRRAVTIGAVDRPPSTTAIETLAPLQASEAQRRIEKVVGCPPLVKIDERQRREFQELLDADTLFMGERAPTRPQDRVDRTRVRSRGANDMPDRRGPPGLRSRSRHRASVKPQRHSDRR